MLCRATSSSCPRPQTAIQSAKSPAPSILLIETGWVEPGTHAGDIDHMRGFPQESVSKVILVYSGSFIFEKSSFTV